MSLIMQVSFAVVGCVSGGSCYVIIFMVFLGVSIGNFLTEHVFCVLLLNWNGKVAGVAQLVEYKLPKLGVASSNLVARSSVDGGCIAVSH